MATEESYVPNAFDAEFDNFWDTVSCYAANTFPFEERCAFGFKLPNSSSQNHGVSE